MERVQLEEEPFQTHFWGLVREFSLIDARKNLSIIRARLETIEKLDAAMESGATEVPVLHDILKEFPWLIDPRYQLFGDEVNVDELPDQPLTLTDDETGDILDFLFILKPTPPAEVDQVLVVEIKRARKTNLEIHVVSEREVDKFYSYVLGVKEFHDRNTYPPAVTGLMVASGYSNRAERKRRNLERSPDPSFKFQTWKALIDHTRRLHTSWLEVTRATAARHAH